MNNIMINAQDIRGKTIHDDGAANFCRYKIDDFIELKKKNNTKIIGVDGPVMEAPKMGTIKDGEDLIRDVIFTSKIDYNIDSPFQLVDYYGWQEDKNTGPRTRKYFKVLENGERIERTYERKFGEPHLVRINSNQREQEIDIENIIFKMQILHENYGHMKIRGMMNLLKIYPAHKLGFSVYELQIFSKHFGCRACKEGQSTKRRKDRTNNLIYIDYFTYGFKEGIHVDVFFVDDVIFLLARSHKFKYRWIKILSDRSFSGHEMKEKLLEILGDYKYTERKIQFIRSDNAPTFVCLKSYMQMMGIRWYMAPPGMKTTRAERDGRTIKDQARILINALKYKMPKSWIPDLLKEAVFHINIRYDEGIKGIPLELFFNESINYGQDFKFKFGDIIAYPSTTSNKTMISNLYYGAIVGRDQETGNLIVENFLDKQREKICKFESIIEIDNDIIEYFEIYENVLRFDYNANKRIITLNVIDKKTSPITYDNFDIIKYCRMRCNPCLVDGIPKGNNALGDAQESIITKQVGSGWRCPRHVYINVLHELYNNLSTNDINSDLSKMDSEDEESITIGNDIDKALEVKEVSIHDITNTYHILALQMKYESMYKLHPDLAKKAGLEELGTISDRNTLVGVNKQDIPMGEKIVYIMTRYVEKFKAGIFVKVKARTLLGGDVLKDVYELRWDELNARTISLSTLYMCLAIMAHEEMDIATMDFKNAFLYAELPEDDQCYAKLTPDNVKLLLEHDPEKWNKFVNKEDGCIYVKVKGALYGHPKAPLLWYEYIRSKLILIGFAPLNSEACIFIRISDGKLSIICLHVDDLIIGTKDNKLFDELREFKKNYFKDEGTLEIGVEQEYLNMHIKFDKADKSVVITQEPYWIKMMNKFNVQETKKVPHTYTFMERLRKRDEEIKGTDKERLNYLSIIMSILWGAKRSFPSVLFNVTALASQNKYGTKEDYDDAMRVLEHINLYKDKGVRLKIKGKVQLSVFVDSSCNLHKDTKGHGGFVISLGSEGYGGPIETNSNKAKTNGRSSLEYELFEVHAMLPSLMLLREVLEELGYKQDPIIIFEDNKAMIDLLRRGKVNSGVTKHIAAKYYYARDLMKLGIIIFKYCPTLLMIADIFTKNLSGPRYIQLWKRLINYADQDELFSDEIYAKLYQNDVGEIFSEEDHENKEIMDLVINFILNQDYIPA